MKRLWLRVEATPSIGLGHVMRTIALAQAARARSIEVTFVSDAPLAIGVIERHGFMAQAASERWYEHVAQSDAIVLDGYEFGMVEQRWAKATGAVVGMIDDFGEGTFDVDLLVNPNPVREAAYRLPAGGEILCGPRYALLREVFQNKGEPRSKVEHLVLTFGGSDPAGVLGRCAPVLQDRGSFARITAVVGPGAEVPPNLGDDVVVLRDPPDVAEVFRTADAAVCAAGGTTWELLCLGIPTAVVQVADNQVAVLEAAHRHRAVLLVGGPDDVELTLLPTLELLADPATRDGLQRAALQLVDGLGAERVLNVVSQIGDRRR